MEEKKEYTRLYRISKLDEKRMVITAIKSLNKIRNGL
jgi:hypothetical protein